MHNMVYLIGRLSKDIDFNENDGTAIMNVAVQRTFKDEDGIYQTDFFGVKLNGAIASNTAEYCRKGDLIGLKGSLRNDENGTYIVAEKISFLASTKSHDEDTEDIDDENYED